MQKTIKTYFATILNSYAQVFFSENKILGALLLVVSFFDPLAGTGGIISVSTVMLIAHYLNFNPNRLHSGMYGFNALLVGLGIGLTYAPTVQWAVILVVFAVLTFFTTLLLEGVFAKYALPFLSIPFLISIWLLTLSADSLTFLGLSQRGIYTANELYAIGGNNLVQLYYWGLEIPIPESLRIYFLSLGAIFFQANVLSGLLISIGLLFYSRIAFTLSLFGLYLAFGFYQLIGANFSELSYTYIGFNFILTSIAVGGYFIIPSRSSYLWLMVLLPITVLITISLSKLFYIFGLAVYSLPFNVVVLLYLYVLKLRMEYSGGLIEVPEQQKSPESNLYHYHNEKKRFESYYLTSISLPVMGEWSISQAHQGEHTHKGEWAQAWDFVITDQSGQQFSGKGDYPTEYYCFDKNVIAPADGTIEEIVGYLDDNIIGDTDIANNWGNTIVIKHNQYLYTQLSHLKKDSVRVKVGQTVQKGEVIAKVGNSGRSPYPHLHFQVQQTPYIGSKTLWHPLSAYVASENNHFVFYENGIPKVNQKISSIKNNPLLSKAFHWVPGQRLIFSVENSDNKHLPTGLHEWEIQTTPLNESYIHDPVSGDYAFYKNTGTLHYFYRYQGQRNSLLYYFYLAFYKTVLGYYSNLKITDILPTHNRFGGFSKIAQDFVAPFGMFLVSEYRLTYQNYTDDITSQTIDLTSGVTNKQLGVVQEKLDFQIHISAQAKLNWNINTANKTVIIKQY